MAQDDGQDFSHALDATQFEVFLGCLQKADSAMRRFLRVTAICFAVGLSCGWAMASEPDCYRTAEDAVAQAGARGVQGFRVETVRRDIFSGAAWATVRSCTHPEWPASLLLVASGHPVVAPARLELWRPSPERIFVVRAGTRVRLVATDENTRLEASGVALANAALGDRIQVRLLPVSAISSDPAPERLATGIVRGRDLVEWVTP